MLQRRQIIQAFVLALLLSSLFWSSLVYAESEVLIQKTGPITVQKTVVNGFQDQVDEIIVGYTFYPNGSLLVWNTLGEEFFFQAPGFQPDFAPVVTLFQNSTHVAQHFWVNGSQTNPEGLVEVRTLDLWVYFKFVAQNAKITLTGTTNDVDSEVEYEFENPKSANIASNMTSYRIGAITFDWSDLQGATLFEFALNKLKVKFESSFNLDPTIICPVLGDTAIIYSLQRKLVYANSYWHVFYYGGDTSVYHRSSTDGGSWSSASVVLTDTLSGAYFSVWCAGNYGFIVSRQFPQTLRYTYGSFTSSGQFSKIASEVLVGNYSGTYPNIAVDSVGLPYIIYHNVSTVFFQVTKSTTATAWTTAAGYPKTLNVSTTARSIVPLTSGKMLTVYYPTTEAKFYSKYYDGSNWQAPQLVSSSDSTLPELYSSLVAISDTAYFAHYISGAVIQILKWTASSGWLEVGTVPDRDGGSSLSVAGTNLYLFTTSSDLSTVHWRKYAPSTNSWGEDASVINGGEMYYINSLYESNIHSESAFMYWTGGPPYIKFRRIASSDVPQTYEEMNPVASSVDEGETGTPLETTNQTQVTIPFVLPRLGTYGIFIGLGLIIIGAVMYAVRGNGSTRRRRTVAYAHRVQPAPRSSQYHPPPKPKRRYT